MSSPTDRLRADAENAFRTAVRAVQPGPLIAAAVRVEGPRIEVAGRELPAVAGRRLLAAVGKAAPGLATAWLRRLPGWADRVLVITPRGVPVDPELEAAAAIRRGSHPFPDAAGEAAAREVLARAGELGEDDLLVLLLSGGGSALLAAPEPGLGLDQVITVTRELLASGAPIGAVNTVRREILAAAGGGLARAAFPARVLTLVISDVIGDPLPDIASGPTVASPTGPADALAVLERYRITGPAAAAVAAFLRRRLAAGARDRREWTRRTRTVVLANNRTAVEAAAAHLDGLGYRTLAPAPAVTGEAAARGRQLGALAVALRPGGDAALVFGGETTVTVHGDGRGGRNQELALAAATVLDGHPGRVLLAAGTDGIDGLTEAAGAVVDGGTVDRLAAAGLDAADVLARNDSGTALGTVGDALVTGPTGTNVCDLTVVLAAGS